MKDKKPTPISEYLAEQGAEGSYDSKGAFTLAEGDAWRKLAAFQLAYPEDWILVLVQAAHRGGVSKIKVTQSARATTVVLQDFQSWSWDQLLPVLEGHLRGQPALLGLGVAVRALTGHRDKVGFSVTAPDGSARQWDGQAMVPRSAGLGGLLSRGNTVITVDHAAPGGFFSFRKAARAGLTAVQRALVTRCLASAVPIVCDGLRINGLDRGTPAPADHHRLPVALLPLNHQAIPTTDFSAAMDWEESAVDGLKVVGAAGPVKWASGSSLSGLALLTATVRRYAMGGNQAGVRRELGQGSSELLWVLDGVVVHRTSFTLNGSLALTIVASARGMRTDLSGLQLVHGQELTRRRKALRSCSKAKLQELAGETRVKPLEVTDKRTTVTSTAVGLAIMVGGSMVTLGWIMAVPTGLAILYFGYTAFDSAMAWEEKLLEELRTLPQRAEGALQG